MLMRATPMPPFSLRRCLRLCVLALCIGNLSGSGSGLAVERERALTGRLLVATPQMQDPRFIESVIFIVNHDAQGAMGLVINKPIAKGLIDDLLESSGQKPNGSQEPIVIHYGGPVGKRHGFMLHTDDHVIDGTRKLGHGIAMTTDIKMLHALASGKGPRRWLFMIGYAGWASGQLEAELNTGSWFTLPGDQALIFGADADKKWRQAMDKRQIPL